MDITIITASAVIGKRLPLVPNDQGYLALARAQAQVGDIVGAENYYQHAEHYFRSMSPDREAAPPVFGTRGADEKHDR
jgi:Domain of unknown function (DUF4167)